MLSLVVLLSGCAMVESAPPNPAGDSTATSTIEATDAEEPLAWWEGRTWGGEIDVCAEATLDESGCQWLAGWLIHRRCELKTYQTFAAALFVGGSLTVLFDDAVLAGDCREERDVSSADTPSSSNSKETGFRKTLERLTI
ncbi:MAG TPA: hypothetical protein VMM14_05015 [Acidimicrobiia bacterium]|nr:hypothetical protein [Acidimicrobiia bacterium]